jgi:hypothetical protein
MPIGPFTTYAPPGVYTQTVVEPIVGQLLGGLRVPVLIGVGQETLTQTDIEMIRGSSSFADTPIFGEDPTGRWIIGGSPNNPITGTQDGNRSQLRVRNYPIVDGEGVGRTTYDVSKVSVSVNNQQVVVAQVDGANGIISLLVPPGPLDVVSVNYYFHRKDTRVTDVVSSQVTTGAAILVAPKAENYDIQLGVNDVLEVYVNDATASVQITLTPGTRSSHDIASDILAAAVNGLGAAVHIDNQGFSHIQLVAAGNVKIGAGTANGILGYNPGDYTNRNATFRVFNGPIVDGSDGGITTTDTSKVVVLVNGLQVIPISVDGANQAVTLASAPSDGSSVTIQYWFNTWQDTFDYLPNSNIVSVGNVGISPGRRDFFNGPDFIISNEGDQSKILWGTAWQVSAGETNGSSSFDSTQVVGMLVDDRIFGVECSRYTDPTTNAVSTIKFTLPLKPTTGNGRDTPLGSSLYQTVTNNRIDLPTNRPDLVIVYVGKTFRDAYLRPPVTVAAVDSSTNTFVLKSPVPADLKAFATFWYNRIQDDVYTLSVITPGPSGVGKYTVTSQLNNNAPLYGVKFGTKSSLPQIVQWPSGVESVSDAIHYGGSPVSETVTVTFLTSLLPATHASFSNANAEPYDIYTATQQFGGIVVDGNPAVTVNLSTAFRAQLFSQPIDTTPFPLPASAHLVLQIDGVNINVDVGGVANIAAVVLAINAVIDADTQVHADGTGTFFSTLANNLASVVAYGSQSILRIRGRNLPSATNGYLANVKVLSPTAAGETNAAPLLGLASNLESLGSYNALNQPAMMVGTKIGTFNITASVDDLFLFNVDGQDYSAVLPSGSTVLTTEVVEYINAGFVSTASDTVKAAALAAAVTLANQIRTEYEAHRVNIAVHIASDVVNTLGAAATDLPSLLVLCADIKAKLNAHYAFLTAHSIADAANIITATTPTDLSSAMKFLFSAKASYEAHRVLAEDLASTITLANTLRTRYTAHIGTAGSVHLAADAVNTLGPAATDLPSLLILCADIRAKFNAHYALLASHGIADAVNPIVLVAPVDLSTAITFLNTAAASYNAHRVLASGLTYANTLANNIATEYALHAADVASHLAADVVNTIVAPPATDLPTLLALCADLRAKLNAHYAFLTSHHDADAVNPIVPIAPVDLPTALAFLNVAATSYNAHRILGEALVSSNALANNIATEYTLHAADGVAHNATPDVTNAITAPAATNLPSLLVLCGDIRTTLNAHYAQLISHTNADAVNPIVLAAPIDLPTAVTFLEAARASYEAHRVLTAGPVHSSADITNVVTATLIFRHYVADTTHVVVVAAVNYVHLAADTINSIVVTFDSVHMIADIVDVVTALNYEPVASVGLGINAGFIILKSLTNTVSSMIGISTLGTANLVLGFSSGASATRTQPTAGIIAAALNANTGFNALAAAWRVQASGLGGFLRIDSLSEGSTSTLSFTAVSNTTFMSDTNIGIVPGTSGDVGEAAQSGFQVASSSPNGSSGTGTPGQTYTDAKTGLRFTVLPAAAGDYANGGSFKLIVDSTFTADASIPVKELAGLEMTVYNTLNMGIGTTALVSTYARGGNEPAVGDIYYTSYQYAKTDLSTQLFRDLKRIQQNFGPATPDFPLSLAAKMALLNGAVLVGLKQVLKAPNSSQASVGSFTTAIDEQRKPIQGSVNPDVITPLGTDPEIFGYLNQHCVFMSSPRQAAERTGIVGVAAGTNPLGVQSIAQGLISELMVVGYPDSYVISIQDTNGNTFDQLVDGTYMAASLAGASCNPSIDVATPWTRRQIFGFKSLGRVLDPTEANQIAVAGVSVIEAVDSGMRIRHGLTTRTDNLITRTPSVTLTIQYVQQSIRRVLDPYIGQKFTGSLLKTAENAIVGMFSTLIDQQIVSKVAGISVSVDENDPTIMRTESIYVPVFPLEYVVSVLQVRIRI